MKVSELIGHLAQLPLEAEVRMSISFTRDTAEDEGMAYAPIVQVTSASSDSPPLPLVLLMGAEDHGVADENGEG